MSSKKTALCALVASAMIGLATPNSLAQQKSDYIYCTVLSESGSVVDKTNGYLEYPTYVIQFTRLDDRKMYTFQILNKGKLEALSVAIKKGTKIAIQREDFYFNLNGVVGLLPDYALEVLPPE
jgi:hypothetical protein